MRDWIRVPDRDRFVIADRSREERASGSELRSRVSSVLGGFRLLDEIYDSLHPERKPGTPFASVRCARSASDRVLAAVRLNDGLRGLRGRREGGTFIRGFLGESFFTARPRVSIQLRRRSANKRKSREIFRRIAGVLGGISLISRSSSGKCRGGPRELRKFRSLVTYRDERREYLWRTNRSRITANR